MRGDASPMHRRLAVALAIAVAAVALGAPAAGPLPPPGVLPSAVEPSLRPRVTVAAAVQAQPLQRQRVEVPVPPPPPGSAAESEAVRRYVRGRQRELDGQFRRAIEEVDSALRLDADSASLHAARARLAAQVGDGSRAVKEWELVLARSPSDPRALRALGIDAFRAGDHPRASALLGRAWLAMGADGSPAPDRAEFGGALARSLLRTRFDSAGVEVALETLGPQDDDVLPVDAEPGPAERDLADLAAEAGLAALRCGAPDVAFGLFARSHLLEPAVRTLSLAAFSQLRSGDERGARSVLGVMLDEEPWRSPESTAHAAWLLAELGADPAARERLGLAALSEGGMIAAAGAAPAEDRARIGLLLVAAGDPAAGEEFLARAIADGARDPAAVRAACRLAGDAGSPAVAAEVIGRFPPRLGEVVGAMLRACRDGRALRSAIESMPESALRESLAAAVLAALHAPGDAWRRARAAQERWPGRLPLEAMLLAAGAAVDPALVARAAAQADEVIDADPAWHAALARGFALTGAGRDADLELARAELLADPGDGDPFVESAIGSARAVVDGRAPEGSPRSRAEQEIARRDAAAAVGELLMARAVDPDDAAALGMLVRLLPRVEGTVEAADWLDRELAAHPNEPLLWDSLVVTAIAERRPADALARIDARLSADPDDPMVLPGREVLLRALGRSAEAAAAARGRIASLPEGPRRSLDQAEAALLAGEHAEVVQALVRFEEGAYPPPPPMRALALDIVRRVPGSEPGRAGLLRRLARDAIEVDPRSSLEFRAFEALGWLTEPGADRASALAEVRAIASEASGVPELRADAPAWRAAADFLLAERQPAAGAEFLRARLLEPGDLGDAAVGDLVRAAVACDAAAGGRSTDALGLVTQLAAAGFRPLDEKGRPAGMYASLAGIFRMMGDDDGADRILEAALAVDPQDAGVLNNLGYSLLLRGQLSRSAQLLERASDGSPESAPALDSLGWLRYLQGRIADSDGAPGAISLLRRAVDAAGAARSAEQLDHLGDALWRGGDRDGARRAWEEAVLAASGGVSREEHLESTLRPFFRRVTRLSAADPGRYYDAHEGAAAARARAKAEAAAQGREPAVAAPAQPPAPPR